MLNGALRFGSHIKNITEKAKATLPALLSLSLRLQSRSLGSLEHTSNDLVL